MNKKLIQISFICLVFLSNLAHCSQGSSQENVGNQIEPLKIIRKFLMLESQKDIKLRKFINENDNESILTSLNTCCSLQISEVYEKEKKMKT